MEQHRDAHRPELTRSQSHSWNSPGGSSSSPAQRPGYFASDPVEQFKTHVWVSPFWEDDLLEVVGYLGVDQVLFGSDYPHPEGLAEPRSYVNHLPDGLADEDVAKIMGGNLAEAMRVPVTV